MMQCWRKKKYPHKSKKSTAWQYPSPISLGYLPPLKSASWMLIKGCGTPICRVCWFQAGGSVSARSKRRVG